MSKLHSKNDAKDPVVKTIPVYISKILMDKLFIFQYPVKPASDGYDDAEFLKTAVKPMNQEVKLEIRLDTDSNYYSRMKGEQICVNADGPTIQSGDHSKRVFDSQYMDKIVLQSSKAISDCTNYAVGIYQDGELHITPITGILQLRPQFSYLDASEKHVNPNPNEGETEPVTQVNVAFARQNTEAAQKKQEQSFQMQSKKSSEEEWIETTYRSVHTSQSEQTRLEMFCPVPEARPNTLKLSTRDYVNFLIPRPELDEYTKTVARDLTSWAHIRTLPLLDQVKALMKNTRVVPFSKLRSVIAPEHETTTILKYLQQVAVLVQGNWIVNSELIYPPNTKSSQHGVTAELMCRARDYILLAFTENEFVARNTVSSVLKLPAEEIAEIFKSISQQEIRKGWKLIRPYDPSFQMKYPEIAQRQELLWENKRKSLKELMEAPNHPLRQRRKSNREFVGSENEERNITRGQSKSRNPSMSDDGNTDSVKHRRSSRSRKPSET